MQGKQGKQGKQDQDGSYRMFLCCSQVHFPPQVHLHVGVVFAVSIPFTRRQLAPPELELPASPNARPRIHSNKSSTTPTLLHSRPAWGPR